MVAERIVIAIGAAVVGLCFGSFLNVCILRLPHDQSLLRPPSTCPRCQRAIAWYDNIPLFSWLVLRGRCRRCGAPISWQYPAIELLVGLLFLGAYLAWGVSPYAIAAALFGTILLGIAITDAREFVIPDEFNYGGLALGLALSLFAGWRGLLDAFMGAAFGFALLWATERAATWALKKDSLGGGDIKMMAMVGSFVGWRGVLLTVFTGALLGSLVYLPLMLWRKHPNPGQPADPQTQHWVPFGVFLAVGAAFTFVYGDAMFAWYLTFLRGY